MFESAGNLFSKAADSRKLDESDIRMYIQMWFRDKTHSEGVYCEGISGGKAIMRVSSPALHQQVRLLEAELVEVLANQQAIDLRGVVVRS